MSILNSLQYDLPLCMTLYIVCGAEISVFRSDDHIKSPHCHINRYKNSVHYSMHELLRAQMSLLYGTMGHGLMHASCVSVSVLGNQGIATAGRLE